MKILLVLPAAEHLRITSQNPEVPKRPMLRFSILPLTTVAALTPPEHEVAICDENVQMLDFEADVDLVGVSFMTALAPRAYEIAAEFRRRGKWTVAGGFHPTFMPDEVLRHFNAVAVGDAEEVWPRVVRDAQAGTLQGIYRHSSAADLALTPQPRRDLMQSTGKHYATLNAVQTGRGCRHACRYCSVTAFHGGTYRTRPIDHVLKEIENLGRDIIFVDDNIIADPEYARRLFQALIPLKKRWVSQCSIKIADEPELLKLARASGCRGLFIGIESTSEENLAAVKKGFNQAGGYRERIRRIRQSGIGVIAGIIVGMDADDKSVFERTLAFLKTCGIDALQLNIMTPLPGTPLFRDFSQAGRIIDVDWRHYDFRHVVIQPRQMSADELQQGADWLYHQFYRLDRIVARTLKTFMTAGLAPAVLTWKLNMTYRFDNQREQIKGRNPAQTARHPFFHWSSKVTGTVTRAATGSLFRIAG